MAKANNSDLINEAIIDISDIITSRKCLPCHRYMGRLPANGLLGLYTGELPTVTVKLNRTGCPIPAALFDWTRPAVWVVLISVRERGRKGLLCGKLSAFKSASVCLSLFPHARNDRRRGGV